MASDPSSWLRNLQQCREELNSSQVEVVRLRQGLTSVEDRVQKIDAAMGSFCDKSKNPFKLLLSRMMQPGEMRRERKSIEAEMKAITREIRNLRTTAEMEQTKPVAKAPNVPSGEVNLDLQESDFTARHHVIISGTGRAGTTFLMELLTSLGLDTGFQHYRTLINENAQAGLERDLRDEGAPYIVKNPALCEYLEEVLESGRVHIDHAFIPVRDMGEAARSRARIEAMSKVTGKKIWGGLWDASEPDQQELVLKQKLCQIIVTLARYSVPTTLLFYPRLVLDAAYLYEKLQPLLGSMTLSEFEAIFRQVSRPELVSSP